jgi:parvulin-like peptidyl-prolyl isomerase
MQRFLGLIIILTINISIARAEIPQIVALVNNTPITLYEFQARKKMTMVLNDIVSPNINAEKQINNIVLNNLINEELLYQHAAKVGGKISDTEIDEAIANFEERNKMPKGYMVKFLTSHSVDIKSFRSQIKAELIKMNILSYISKSVTISAKEIDYVILSNNAKDAKVTANVFTSKDKDKKTLQKMYVLQKQLKNCDNIKESIYNNFSSNIKIDENLSKLDTQLRTVIKDLDPGQASNVFETSEGFKLILVCSKKIDNITDEESNYIVNFLSNKKMSQKAQKFFDDLHKKAYIKIMLPR